jgi:hypothetical protein
MTGGYAHVTGGESGDRLWVVDLSDPASPTAVSTYTLPVFFACAAWGLGGDVRAGGPGRHRASPAR